MTSQVQAGYANSASRRESREFRWILAVSFLAFLVVAVIARCLPRRWRPWSDQSVEPLSVIAEAKAMANTYAPFIFMC
jgi:hypothetical protein